MPGRRKNAVVKEGEVIFAEGDAAHTMYILEKGCVELTKRGKEGETVLRTIATPNSFFGEMALIDGRPRSATAKALRDSSLIVVDKKAFDFMLETNLDFSAKILRMLIDRIRRANSQLVETIDLKPRVRISRAIADYAIHHGSSASLGARYVQREALQIWLHGHVGISYEQAGTELRGLIEDGSIKATGTAEEETLTITGSFIRENDRRGDKPPAEDTAPRTVARRPGFEEALALSDRSGGGKRELRFDKGRVIFREGEAADCMFILLDGKVELAKRGEKGQTIVKTVAKPMEFFGEMAVIDGRTRSATATALAETRLAAVDRAAFEALFETNATFAARVVKTLSTRIRNSNENLTEIIDTPPKERILRAIVDYAEQFGEGFVQGARYVEMPALRVWLNGHIGVAPEEVDAAVFQCVKADELARVGEDEQTLLVPIPVIKVYERRVSDPAL